MEAAAERYGQEVHDQLRMYPTWWPDEDIEVGDFGSLTKNIFSKDGNLRHDKGLKYSVIVDGTADPTYEFASKGSQQTKIAASGSAASTAGKIAATLRLTFGSAYSVFFNLQGCSGFAVKDKFKFKKDILDLTERGDWDPGYFIATRVVKADVATIIQSSDSDGEIDLSATDNVIPIDDIFKVAGGVAYSSKKSIGFSCFAKKEIKPLLRLGRVKTRFFGFGKPDFESSFATSGFSLSRISMNPFKSAVRKTGNVALSSPTKSSGDVYLTVRMPRKGGYADATPMFNLLHQAGTLHPAAQSKAARTVQVALEPLQFAVERTNGVDFGLSQPTAKGHVLLNVRIPHVGGFADMKPVRQLLVNLVDAQQKFGTRHLQSAISFEEIE
jgi:hypothetical protein